MRGLIPSYLSAAIATTISLSGFAGLFELINYVGNTQGWQSDFEFLGLTVATRSPWPWLMGVTLAGSGAALCRVAYRRVGQVWRATNAIVAEQTSA
jgi:hypothetical protein